MSSRDWVRLLGEPFPWRPPRPLPSRVETARTVVRLFERGDGPTLFDAVERSRDQLLPWMLWAATDHRHVDDSIHYVESQRLAYVSDASRFSYGIFDRTSGALVGCVGFHDVRAGTRQAEVGWWIATDVRGRGIAPEAVSALVDLGFRSPDDGGYGLRRIVAVVATANHASRRVAEKVGMRLEGTLRAERFLGYPEDAPMGYVDTFLFASLVDDERPRR
jgi:RimJ/RimL family protein N-acetyltransferase